MKPSGEMKPSDEIKNGIHIDSFKTPPPPHLATETSPNAGGVRTHLPVSVLYHSYVANKQKKTKKQSVQQDNLDRGQESEEDSDKVLCWTARPTMAIVGIIL